MLNVLEQAMDYLTMIYPLKKVIVRRYYKKNIPGYPSDINTYNAADDIVLQGHLQPLSNSLTISPERLVDSNRCYKLWLKNTIAKPLSSLDFPIVEYVLIIDDDHYSIANFMDWNQNGWVELDIAKVLKSDVKNQA